MARRDESIHKDLIVDHDTDVSSVEVPIEESRRGEVEEVEQPVKEDPRSPIEIWAERKGFLPQLSSSDPPRPNPEYAKFAAAKGLRGWAPGTLVTEAEFDEAIEQQGKQAIR